MGVKSTETAQTQTQTLIYQQPIHLNGVSNLRIRYTVVHTEQDEFKLKLFRHERMG